MRTISDVPELNQLTKMIPLTSDLAGRTLETIESKFVIEGRDLVDKDATGFSTTEGHTTCFIAEERIIYRVSAGKSFPS